MYHVLGFKLMPTPIYESSTQFLHWRYSPEQLASVRAALNATAVTAIRLTLEAEKVSGNYVCIILPIAYHCSARLVVHRVFFDRR